MNYDIQKSNRKEVRNLIPDMDLSLYPELQGREGDIRLFGKYLQTAIYWKDLPIISQEADGILLSEDFFLRSHYLRDVFAESMKVTIGCVTLGPAIVSYIKERMAGGDYYLATLADGFASHYIEFLTEKWVEQRKKEHLTRGLHPTLRFSPGYGDFSLENQKPIIQSLALEQEITVTESFLLEPEKTITFVMGWSQKPQPQTYPIPENENNNTILKSKGCPGNGNCQYCITKACRT